MLLRAIRVTIHPGQFITYWGLLGSDPDQLNQPKGLTIDEDNNVYIADEFNNRIQKFDSNSNFITEFEQDSCSRFSGPYLFIRFR
jgi:DNA-binding beta-propeller fold protein YncE